jgi:hypothetical protein
MDFSHD